MYARVPNSLKKRRSGRSEPHGYRLAVRRVGICVFLGLLAPTVVGVGTASAHLCTYAAQIKVGVPQQTISIGVTVEDVTVPDGRLCDQLRRDQDRHFGMLPISATR